jgi:chorismate synthase
LKVFGQLGMVLFGESHGCCVGVVIEGVPPGIPFDVKELAAELAKRRPGGALVSPRSEPDVPEVVSGVFRGYTTGAPLAVLVRNRDVDSTFYEEVVRWRPRPGHSDLAARLHSMGFEDYRGAGFHSGRLTAGIVVAGYVARKILEEHGVSVAAYLRKLGGIECSCAEPPLNRDEVYRSPVRCPCPESERSMVDALKEAQKKGLSLGGAVEVHAYGLPKGVGEPHTRLDADVAAALASIPGVKGVEFGLGFRLADMNSSQYEERIEVVDGSLKVLDVGGGFEAGYSVGDPLVVRAVFRPTSTVRMARESIDYRGLERAKVVGRGRHDPAIAVRGVIVVESMFAFVLAGHFLSWLSRRLRHYHRLERGLV